MIAWCQRASEIILFRSLGLCIEEDIMQYKKNAEYKGWMESCFLLHSETYFICFKSLLLLSMTELSLM